jgi:LPXTG-site transpeptidase (sortase) family protein
MKKRLLRGSLSLMIVFGVVLAIWPLGQDLYAQWNQRQLQAQWKKEATPHAASTRGAAKSAKALAAKESKVSGAAAQLAGGVATEKGGAPLPKTRLEMPDIGVDAVVVSGVDEESLRRGPGHFPGTALPGQSGNCVIAGHRNVYGSWFYKLDSLFPGQSIYLETPDAKYEYRVVRIFLNADTDTALLQPPPADARGKVPAQLTLITCTTPRTTNRLVLVAQRPAESAY